MAFSDTRFPCGGRKERETMLCSACVSAFQDRREFSIYQDESYGIDFRRNAAIVILTLARGRLRRSASHS